MTREAASAPASNAAVAAVLREIAELLSEQGANFFRVNAYRHAADTVDGLTTDLRDLLQNEGREGLIRLPAIGDGIAATIDEILSTGRSVQLDRLRGDNEPEQVLQRVPGIGPELARQLHDELHVDTLEGLEVAAHDGRLERVPGIGPRRAQAIRANLASMLQRRAPRRAQAAGPEVATLLAVDQSYREQAAAGKLPLIAPRRFNPSGNAWLPVLHANREGWHFTALFSNTALAHRLGRTRDWVVLYFYDDNHQEGQHTVVTETRGPLEGQRVVRGREAECARHYAETAARA